ncbi:hypothetical protein ACROYT_G018630 [Oculina patagonica]
MAVNYVVVFCLFSVLLISAVNSREDEEEFDASDICKLKPESGMCMAYFQKWYFNTSVNQCMTFVYGGCRGNGNRFDSKKECEKRCLPANDKELQSSFDEQEKKEESSSTHQDDKEQHSADEQETQEGPCTAALVHHLKKAFQKEKLLASIMFKGAPMFRPKHVHMPTCDEEGYYAPMQCLKDRSKCWHKSQRFMLHIQLPNMCNQNI